MSVSIPSNRTPNCCYAHEQCILAHEQWSRLLDNMMAQTGKGSILQARTSIDPGLTRLLSRADFSPSGSVLSDCTISDNKGSGLTSNRRGLTPWKSDEKRYSPGLKGLDEEIIDFYHYILPQNEEKKMRLGVVSQITDLITELWPAAKVEVFGSYTTGLYLPTSDVDVVVMYWEIDAQTPDVMQKALMTLEKQLINKGTFDDVKVIRTSVPIVKLTDRETAIKVDVGFNVSTGLQSVQFIQEKLSEYPQLQCLVFVLKQFLVYHNLLESFNGGISSYCLILLIISYLQLNCEEENLSHGQHLIRFLELYGCHFNYLRTGIRIRDGGSYFPKNDRQDGESENRYQFSLLYIEDPLDPANDVGKGCYGAMKVRDAFADAYRDLRDAVLPQYQSVQSNCSTFLGRILGVPREIVQYRRFISQKYAVGSNTEDRLVLTSANTIPTDDRSDSGSICSQTSNKSSFTKSSQCRSQSTGSGAVSDNESDANSDTAKATSSSQHQTAAAEPQQCVVYQSLPTEMMSASSQQQHHRATTHPPSCRTLPSVYSPSATEPPSRVAARPSTLSLEEQQTIAAKSLSASAVTTTGERVLGVPGMSPCTVTMTTTQSRPHGSFPITTTHGQRCANSNYSVRGNSVPSVRAMATNKATVVNSTRFQKANNSGSAVGGRYTDSSSNGHGVNGR